MVCVVQETPDRSCVSVTGTVSSTTLNSMNLEYGLGAHKYTATVLSVATQRNFNRSNLAAEYESQKPRRTRTDLKVRTVAQVADSVEEF